MSDALETPVDETVDVPEMIDTDAILDDIANEDAPAPVVEEAPESVPTDDEGAEASAETAPVVVETPTQPETPPQPFAFKAFGQEYPVPGTRWNPEKRVLEFEDVRGLQRLQQMLSHGREWEARGRQELVQARKELQQMRETPHAEIEQAKVYLDEWKRLMTMPEQELAEFIMNARIEWPRMEARAERSYAERLMQQAQAAQQPPEPDVEVIVEQVHDTTAEQVHVYVQNQPWATPDIVEKLTQYLHKPQNMNQYVVRAKRDMPEQGLRAGQYAIDWDKVAEILDDYTAPYRHAHEQQATAAQRVQQTQTVAAQNGKALAQAKPKPNAPTRTPATPPQPKKVTKDDIIGEAFNVWREQARAR